MKVVFLGCTDNYGYGYSANVTKINLIVQGLRNLSVHCSIHNGIAGYSKISSDETKIINGIPVTTYKKRGNILTSCFLNFVRLYKYLKKEKVNNDTNVVVLELPYYHVFLTYVFLAKILGFKVVDISHEWGIIVPSVRTLKKPSMWLFAKTFGYFVDGILPISEYIINKIKHFNKPYLKLPILADFSLDKSSAHRPSKSNNQFVYCASVYYDRIIYMIIDAFSLYVKDEGTLSLCLILNGPQNLQDNIRSYIKSNGLESVINIKTQLPYAELYQMYKEAVALLIPLDPLCEQDSARFSQKTAEYLSSQSPIISNNVGENAYYFTDAEMIKCDFNIHSFAHTFKWVEQNRELAKQIGVNGYKKGIECFDCNKNAAQLYDFLMSI